jgi:hypothetical protein
MRSEQTQPSQELRCQPWRKRTIEEGNEETKIDLTYSATNGISRTGPPLGMPILRIIQVLVLASSLFGLSSDHFHGNNLVIWFMRTPNCLSGFGAILFSFAAPASTSKVLAKSRLEKPNVTLSVPWAGLEGTRICDGLTNGDRSMTFFQSVQQDGGSHECVEGCPARFG